MSIVSASNRWLNRFYKILAIMLVLLAVLISAFRLFLPYVENYRQDFQDYINSTNQTNIIIGGLGMSWQRFGPTLIANRVTLIDTRDAYVYINHLEVQIDFWATITEQRLISSDLILDGAIATLKHGVWLAKESIKDKNNAVSSATKEPLDDFQQISDIFLNRINSFSLVNSQVSIENNALERHFRINNLNWLNSGERHQAQGNITVDELSSNNLTLKIDINGASVSELKGQMYVEANHLDITPWLDSVLAIDNEKTKADIGFSAWFKVKQGAIERLQVALHDNFISWRDSDLASSHLHDIQVSNGQNNNTNQSQETTKNETKAQHNLTLSAGQLLLVKDKQPNSFKLYSTPLLLQFDQQAVQETVLQINKSAQDLSVYLSSFDLALISQVSPLFIESKDSRELLSTLNISGQALDVYFKKSAGDVQALASITNTSTKYSQGIPGVDNLAGNLSFAQQNLHVNLTANQGALDFKQHFVKPIPYQSLAATVDLSFADSGWQLKVNDLALTSDELKLSADLTVESPKDEPLSMSLLANITDGDASKAHHYYPLTTMSHDLVDYLNDALTDGEIKQAQVLLNGPLAKFPFTDKSGIFVVNAELEKATFKFSQDWPAIEKFSANLNFTNNSMLITGRAGELVGLDVNGVQAAIDDLGNESLLKVDTLIKPSPATDVANLMAQSSLKDSVGSVLEQLQIGGDINGEFHLKLPLNSTKDVVASGLINFADNTAALQAPRMDFAKVQGQLRFENSKITTEGLSLNWRGLPLTLAVKGNNETDYYDTSISLKADWAKKQWQPHVAPALQKYFDGQLQLQGDLSLYQHHGGGFTYQFSLDSNLAQMALALPEPYKKPSATKIPLKIAVNGQLEKSTFNASYGEQLSFFGELQHSTSHFSRAHVILGDEKMLLPMNGFHITTNLEQADAFVWQPFILDIVNTVSNENQQQQFEGEGSSSLGLFPKPERIRGTIANLDVLGQRLHNVSFNLLDKTNWWLLQLNAKETRSQLKFYPDWFEQGVDINADFIHLVNEPKEKLTEQENTKNASKDKVNSVKFSNDNVFDNMPKINFVCERCQIDNLNLGEVKFSLLRSDENTIKIENFKAKRERAEFNLAGDWQNNSGISTTSVHGTLSLKNIEYELEQLNYGSIIRDSGGKLDFRLNWQGGPHEFDVSYLNGDVTAKIDDGYLAEYSDKARIFSVLSLQSIVRKLTLDFRDIFSDGIFYNNIKGDYHIEKGILYTNNTTMDGAAGNLYIKGNTSFVDNTLDYKMSYKPNLTSSLPVLAWIATLDPVIFLAGLAIDQVITSKVVSEVNFELTGSVNNPNFKEVDRKSRDISVGRSKPPEFVDSSDKTNPSAPKSIDGKSFKEFKSSDVDDQQPDRYQQNKQLEDFNEG